MQNRKCSPEILHVSVYGSHEHKGKRWELAGTKKQLKSALELAVKYPPESRFPRYNPFPNVVLGDWHNDIVKVDWDERSLAEVKLFSKLMNARYSLDGFIILNSSTKLHKIRDETLEKVCYTYRVRSYHTVFNCIISLEKLNSILAWLCLFTKDNKLITWFLLQNIKGTYTLRHGFKGKKGFPKIVFCFGNQDKQIKKFLANRNFILDFLENESEKEVIQ